MIVAATNININNRLATGTVTIVDQYPSVGWVFDAITRIVTDSVTVGLIDSVTEAVQAAFQIVIASVSTNQGTDSFVGDITSTGWIYSAANTWRFRETNLNRGSTYYGQIRVKDSLGNISTWATFSFLFNSLPTVSDLVITPSSPSSHDNLSLSYTFSDADGQVENGSTIWWFKNGVHQRNLDGLVLISSDNLSYGDVWLAQVVPNDGHEFGGSSTSSAVSVTTSTPTVTSAQIIPSDPTSLDPLYASYQYSSANNVDDSVIKWYVNGTLINGVTTAFARLPVNIGDQVYFEIQPNDGVSSGSWVASPVVAILSPPYRVVNLCVDNEKEPLSVISLTPTLSWEIAGPDFSPTTMSVKIGSAPNADNIGSFTVSSSDTSFKIPSGILFPGSDYYASVAIGTTKLGEYQTAHFRTNGSRWASTVSNTVGWTIETTFSTPPLVMGSSSSTTILAEYQGIRIFDGTKNAEIRLYPDHISVVSNQTITELADLTSNPVITIIGKGSDIKVFLNFVLLIDGTGHLLSTTNQSYIQFGSLTGAIAGTYQNFYYTTAGAFDPTSSPQYNNFSFETFYTASGQIDYITSSNGVMYFSASPASDSSVIYQVNDFLSPTQSAATSQSFVNVNSIVNNQNNTYVCHDKGTTVLRSSVVADYDLSMNFAVHDDPANFDWTLFSTANNAASFSADGLVINTLTANGKYYYSQNMPGTPWFDNVTNQKGWRVDFTLAVSAVSNNSQASNTDSPDGAGLYFNDGSAYESVYFFPNEIVFATSGLVCKQNTTTSANYSLVGENNKLSLYANGKLLTTAPFNAQASNEGNGSRPSIHEDSHGNQHAVWQDDGNGGGQIYYSLGYVVDGVTTWSMPQLVASQRFGAANPDVAVDGNGKIYIVFEYKSADNPEIWMVVNNVYGWSQPFRISSELLGSYNPRIAIDVDNNVHAVWSENKGQIAQIRYGKRSALDGKWTLSLLTNSSYPAVRPAIDVDINDVFVTYTQFVSTGFSKIVALFYNGAWSAPMNVGTSVGNADCSDLTCYHGVVYIVWHNAGANYQIYARRFDYNGMALESVTQLTNHADSSRFPTVGMYTGNRSDAQFVYVIWEYGSDIGPTTALGNYGALIPSLLGAYFSSSDHLWHSTYINSGEDITFSTGDSRAFRRPRIPKRFANAANVMYEAEMVDLGDEYIDSNETFVLIKDGVFVSGPSPVTIFGNDDLQVNSKLRKKEIRFGAFSDNITTSMIFGCFSYVSQAVEPFAIALASNLTTSIKNTICHDAAINANGDGWIGSEEGLIFYFRENNQIAHVVPKVGLSGVTSITALAFDRNGTLIVGCSEGFFVSYDRINFTQFIVPPSAYNCTNEVTPTVINSLAIDLDNNLWAATNQGILKITLTQLSGHAEVPLSDLSYISTIMVADHLAFNASCGLPNDVVKKIVVDGNNVVWATCDGGLIQISKNTLHVYSTANSSLPSNQINDIAIRNTSTRYVATASGLVLMTGEFSLVNVENNLWNNNVRCIAWMEPNILWAASSDNLFQINMSDVALPSVTVFTPDKYTLVTPTSCNQPMVYNFTGYVGQSLLDVYVNGRLVSLGYVYSESLGAIVFQSPLLVTDVVNVVIRNDISQFTTLARNKAAQLTFGSEVQTVRKLCTDGTQFWAATTGSNSKLLSYSTADNYTIPYAKIALDSTPPTGSLSVVTQIDRQHVEVAINAHDNLSGVESMIVANYANLTSDGATPLSWINFSPTYTLDLGLSLGNQSDQATFSGYSGKCLGSFNGNLYAGTSGPANMLLFNSGTNTWASIATLNSTDDTCAVEFITTYNGIMVVGTSSQTTNGHIFISSDGATFILLSGITGTGATCSTQLNGTLYIGAAGSGYLYSYNGKTLATIQTSNLQDAPPMLFGSSIYSMSAANGKLYIGTGTTGRIYSYDPVVMFAQIIFLSTDNNIPSVETLLLNSDGTTSGVISPSAGTSELIIFGGTSSLGQIIKSIGGNPFVVSFNGVALPVNAVHSFNNTVFASVGSTLYRYISSASSVGWVAIYTHTEDINDFVIGPDIAAPTSVVTVAKAAPVPPSNNITVISANKITYINGDLGQKKIYLGLMDVAGNVTSTPGTDVGGTGSMLISTSISISQLQNFINSERILELDEYGNTVFNFDGDAPFYSADRVITETGTYVSQIFNGGNDHVTWDIIYWNAQVPDGTDITIAVRTASSRTAIALVPFGQPFTKDQFGGVDISNLSGAYIQFQVILSTTVRGKTPQLFSVVIRSLNSTTIQFFTTNFVLPSQMTKGLITADTFLPIAANIIFGFTTDNSVNFNDYQIVNPNQVFTPDPTQIGTNLRIGVKLISPLPSSTLTDSIEEYGPYGGATMFNIVDFVYTSSVNANVNFKVEFYEDEEKSNLVTTLYTIATPSAWSSDGALFTSNGLAMVDGQTNEIFASVQGNAATRCGQMYYITIYSDNGTAGVTYTPFSSDATFQINCHPTFIDYVDFDVINGTATAKTYQFRVRVYSDATRTELVKTYYTGTDQDGWLVDGDPVTSLGTSVPAGNFAFVSFAPPNDDLDSTVNYFVIVDYITDGDFVSVSNAYTFRTNSSVSFDCSEYINVPVFKNLGIMFDLAPYTDAFGKQRTNVLLNI